MKHASLRILAVEDRQALKRFIRLPQSIYAADPVWISPLLLERREHFSARNPFFEHARWRAWIALRGDKPVGRISAQIDQLHLQRYRDATGFFGSLEAEDDPGIFHALLETAENWLQQQGMRRVRGPFSLSINQECGLLIDGFDTPPVFMMGHARAYYARHLDEQGYTKAQDLLAYRIEPLFDVPPVMQSLVAQTAKQARLRPLRKSRLDEELHILRDIFNDAWTENWGFVPFTEAEFQDLGKALKLVVDEDFVQIAEIDDEPVAMIIILPNINEAIRDLDGKLAPLGWLKLLWRLKVTYPQTARIPLMGVRKRYQNSRQGIGLAFTLINALRGPASGRGIREVELSWILETNKGMRDILERIKAEPYKRYRVYQKELIS